MISETILKSARKLPVALALATALVVTPSITTPSASYVQAQGPASVADLAEGLMSAVVNISTARKKWLIAETVATFLFQRFQKVLRSKSFLTTFSRAVKAITIVGVHPAHAIHWVQVSCLMPVASSLPTIT